MLDWALNHEEELNRCFRSTWNNPKYKYYFSEPYKYGNTLDDTTKERVQLVSLNKEGQIIGYIGYYVDRYTRNVSSFNIINFRNDDFLTFCADGKKVVKDIFERYNYNKLSFFCIRGNDAERHYDRIVKSLGGEIVGVMHNEVLLEDNNLYDVKHYEILKSHYLARKPIKRIKEHTSKILEQDKKERKKKLEEFSYKRGVQDYSMYLFNSCQSKDNGCTDIECPFATSTGKCTILVSADNIPY